MGLYGLPVKITRKKLNHTIERGLFGIENGSKSILFCLNSLILAL